MRSKTTRQMSFYEVLTMTLFCCCCNANSFRPVTRHDALNLCAAGSPASSLSTLDIVDGGGISAVGSSASLPPVPEVVRCGYQCSSTAACVGFNYWPSARRCDFFTSAPQNCSVQQGCDYYSDTGAQACPDKYGSCRQLADNDPSVPSGEYPLLTVTGRRINKVYCDMTLNGGGYTFINPVDVPLLTDAELQAIFTDKTSLLLRALTSTGTQLYGVLQQLPVYTAIPLKFAAHSYSGYTATFNADSTLLGPRYLYTGFVPAAYVSTGVPNGLMVNGNSLGFSNADTNPSSHMVLFPNTTGKTVSSVIASQGQWPFFQTIVNSMLTPTNLLPAEYFMFLESGFGGGGCLVQTDGGVSASPIAAAAIGFR